jgi:hypothetical protein
MREDLFRVERVSGDEIKACIKYGDHDEGEGEEEGDGDGPMLRGCVRETTATQEFVRNESPEDIKSIQNKRRQIGSKSINLRISTTTTDSTTTKHLRGKKKEERRKKTEERITKRHQNLRK